MHALVVVVVVVQQYSSTLFELLGGLQRRDGSFELGDEAPLAQLYPIAPAVQGTDESNVHVLVAQQKSPTPSVLHTRSWFVSSGSADPVHTHPVVPLTQLSDEVWLQLLVVVTVAVAVHADTPRRARNDAT